MDILTAIKERRSVRRFSDKKVDRHLIVEVLAAATWAPTHCNTQGWKFVIVDDEKLKKDMVDLGGSALIAHAPTGVLVLYDNRSDNTEYMDYVQSAAAAIQNILLLAHSYGLAACWVCHLPKKDDLRKVFKIPPVYSPIAYILLGYTVDKPKGVARKYNIQDLIRYNKFDFPKDQIPGRCKGFIVKGFLRRIYYFLPKKIKMALRLDIEKRFVRKFEN